jgi:Domain of unknown function (DUF4386)
MGVEEWMEEHVMTTAPYEDRQLARAESVQRYARVAGVLLLLSLIAGGFGEAYVPSKLIVSSDATATAHNLKAFESLFRMGFAGYLIEAVCDVALSLILYVLLRRVRKDVALLAAFFGLVSTAVFAASELFYLAPSLILGGGEYLKTFTPGQLNTLALLSLKMFGYGGVMYTVFYGLAWVLRGYLIFRSGYLPKFLGVLMTLGGLAFIVRNFLLVLAPSHAPGILLLSMLPGGLALPAWLLVKGVDVRIWAATSDLNV